MGLMLRSPEGTPGKSWPAILIGCFVAFGGVLYGSVLNLPVAGKSEMRDKSTRDRSSLTKA